MRIEESKALSEVLKDIEPTTRHQYKTTLRQFKEFLESREGFTGEISIDEVVEDAKRDVTNLQKRMNDFYEWLQNKKVEGYELRGESMRESSAYQRVYSNLKGFFVNLDIHFEKKWRKKIPKYRCLKEAIRKDKIYTFYDVDEKTRTIRFNRELMQQFLTNLKLRDVAITLALLSSALDSGDLFKLNIGNINEQKGKRIFWEETRKKTKVLFRAFFSKEATRFIRRYIQQERSHAGDGAPLFVYVRNGVERRMTPSNLSSVYRDAARKMGIKWGKREQNPLRPKRMRHLFRTACDTAGTPELYIDAFMGHANSQGQDYSELSRAALELEYLRVEPFLTVYGEVEESLEIKQDVRKLESRIVDLNVKIEEQKRTIADLSKLMGEKVEEITRKLVEKYLKELYEEDCEAQKEEQEWREQQMRVERK